MADPKIVITGDASGLGRAVDQAGRDLQRLSDSSVVSARQSAAAMRQLPAQVTDIATQLAGGANPLLVLLQQGGQIKDSFGGVGNAIRGIGAAVNPVTLAVGGAAAAFGVLGLAIYQGSQQAQKLNRELALTGNAAGLTVEQIEGVTQSLARSTTLAMSDVREVVAGMVGAGEFVGATLDSAARAALAFQKISGGSADEVIKKFAGMTDGVTKWATAANKSFGFLTAAQIEYVRVLEQQGRAQEASRLVLEAFAQTAQARAVPAAGALQKAMEGLASTWSHFWDGVQSVGRPETLADKLGAAQAELEALQKARSGPLFLSFVPAVRNAADREIAGLQGQIEMMQRESARASIRAADAAAERQAEQQKIDDASRTGVESRLALEQSLADRAAAIQRAGLEARRTQLERAYAQFEVTGTAYRDRMVAIERQRLAIEEQLAVEAVQKERQRVADNPTELRAKQASIAKAEAALVLQRSRRAQLEAEIQNGKFDPKARSVTESPQAAFRASELAAQAGVNAEISAQRLRALDEARSLVDATSAIRVGLIRDDRARGEAQIAAEAEALRRRIDLTGASADERRAIEDKLADYVAARQDELTEQLKPMWQRQLEGWRDNARLMQDAYDTALTGALDNAENAWADFVSTGRLNLQTLVRDAVATMARLQFRSAVSWAAEGLNLTSLSSWISGKRADGGPVAPGRNYLVGERGPEILRMGAQGGTVVPNGAKSEGGGSQVIDLSMNGVSVGAGVSRGEMAAALRMMQADTIAKIRRLQRTGVMA